MRHGMLVFFKMAELVELQVANTATETTKKKKEVQKSQRKNFRWEAEMIENLIDCLTEYKCSMAYKNLDFDADKPIQYKQLRLSMAAIYEETESLFGPVAPTHLPDDFKELSKEEKAKAKFQQKKYKELITRGTKRIMEKVKEIRQNFAKAVVSGRRSGSGKIVYEFYEKLISLWGGSANTQPLPYGVSGDDFVLSDSDADNDESVGCPSHFIQNNDSENPDAAEVLASVLDEDEDQENNDEDDNGRESIATNKRKGNCVPQLIDNKRKHLERNLSAAQRDQLLIKEAKEDSQFRKDLAEAMRESTVSFSQSVKDIGTSMTDLGTGIRRSIEMLSSALMHQSQLPVPPVNQNLFYQQHHNLSPENTQGLPVYNHMLNQQHLQQEYQNN